MYVRIEKIKQKEFAIFTFSQLFLIVFDVDLNFDDDYDTLNR